MIKEILFKLFDVHVTCPTCNVYEKQLEYERNVNAQLTETITALLKPAPIIHLSEGEKAPVKMDHTGIWSRRRAELEKNDRMRAALINSKLAAVPDVEVPETTAPAVKKQTIEELEQELGVVSSEDTNLSAVGESNVIS